MATDKKNKDPGPYRYRDHEPGGKNKNGKCASRVDGSEGGAGNLENSPLRTVIENPHLKAHEKQSLKTGKIYDLDGNYLRGGNKVTPTTVVVCIISVVALYLMSRDCTGL